jgi:hypothetical protein
VLHELVRDNLKTLYGAIDDGALDVRLPKHAKKKLEAFLDCGLLCRGFSSGLRARESELFQRCVRGRDHLEPHRVRSRSGASFEVTDTGRPWHRRCGCAVAEQHDCALGARADLYTRKRRAVQRQEEALVLPTFCLEALHAKIVEAI